MGFRRIVDTDYVPAVSLGGFTYGVSAVELASGYAALYNDGYYREPTCIVKITDAQGKFQVVYVKDAARAVLACLGNERAYGQAYNLCQDEIITYDMFFDTLKSVAEPTDLEGLVEVPLTVEQAMSQGVPVPFPAVEQETHLCDNVKGKTELGLVYTDFEEGMRRTYKAFRNVYVQ
jgi:nucleoside-diphosphate-sugar epimerase